MRRVFAGIACGITFVGATAPSSAPSVDQIPQFSLPNHVPELLVGRWGLGSAYCATGGDGPGVVSFTRNTVTVDGRTGIVPAPITSGSTYIRARIEFAPGPDAPPRSGPLRRDLSFSVIGNNQLNMVEFVQHRRQQIGVFRRCD